MRRGQGGGGARGVNVSCQLKFWPFVSCQFTPSRPSKMLLASFKKKEAAFYCLLGRGGGDVECPILFSVPLPQFLFRSAAPDNMLINMTSMIPLHLFLTHG